MNIVILCGRLTADPEVNENRGAFTLAVDKKYKKDGEPTADFIPCVTFGKTKDFVEKYLVKGVKVIVQGRIASGSYTDMDGKPRKSLNVPVDSIEFAEAKRSREEDFKDAENIDGLPFH